MGCPVPAGDAPISELIAYVEHQKRHEVEGPAELCALLVLACSTACVASNGEAKERVYVWALAIAEKLARGLRSELVDALAPEWVICASAAVTHSIFSEEQIHVLGSSLGAQQYCSLEELNDEHA